MLKFGDRIGDDPRDICPDPFHDQQLVSVARADCEPNGGIDTADRDPSLDIWADFARESRDGTSGTAPVHPRCRCGRQNQ